ncbi:MAG: bifunctional N-acetylglucosamine-1-phosphate uridyltransferase/glucosamine-1-phosphate acetyltransferase [Planctomycetes bacterium]|jgi:bifunctional UDP-N-acetylglucosamine pyrophosphorylase/glucosamine-1-phosphate N-acetyltransferase|nr:bifunctional N-acetylglucosamine-1-phosphate uridyltransferase/glucosamine-1-phosphate acetyltransferase [Planctomycetota bacterium]MCL4731985.1 NTP transferase domain-containing protein [Planctomycetota bacterium]
MALKVVILAAGKSTRMKSDTPKVLHRVAGVPLLRWVLEQAATLEPEQIIVIVGHEADRVRKAFAGYPGLTFVTQQPQQGTGHAVMQARAQLAGFAGDVAVLCGDVPLIQPATLAALRAAHAGHAATVLTTELEQPGSYGRVVRDASGRVTAIVEARDLARGQERIHEINSGTYLFDAPALLACLDRLTTANAQGEYYLTDVIRLLAADGRPVAAHLCEDSREVLGINTRQDLALCDTIARRRVADALMLSGVTILDPASTYIEAGVQIGPDTVIYPFSAIHAGVTIGSHCEIGPFAHLRGGTKLGNNCKVGAFVETKNAVYGAGSKSGHLAYLGDVTLGRNVNIGAGSIVANYDGERKHHTEIGDDAFIGCGTVLVAPVKVGKNAQTGANTVVPRGKDVPDNTVVVGAPARVLKTRQGKAT